MAQAIENVSNPKITLFGLRVQKQAGCLFLDENELVSVRKRVFPDENELARTSRQPYAADTGEQCGPA